MVSIVVDVVNLLISGVSQKGVRTFSVVDIVVMNISCVLGVL